MSPLEAKEIVGSLANGIDPETGEILPKGSHLDNPQTIRALFEAVKALDHAAKRQERMQLLPGKAGLPWPEAEDKELIASFDAGTSLKEIAAKHGRTPGAITSRLMRLGRTTNPVEARNGGLPLA